MSVIKQVKDILREFDFTEHARSGDGTWVYFTDDNGLGVEVNFKESNFTLVCNVGMCIQIKYSTLALAFLLNATEDSETGAWLLALSRMERLNDSRVVKNMRREYIEHMRG